MWRCAIIRTKCTGERRWREGQLHENLRTGCSLGALDCFRLFRFRVICVRGDSRLDCESTGCSVHLVVDLVLQWKNQRDQARDRANERPSRERLRWKRAKCDHLDLIFCQRQGPYRWHQHLQSRLNVDAQQQTIVRLFTLSRIHIARLSCSKSNGYCQP